MASQPLTNSSSSSVDKPRRRGEYSADKAAVYVWAAMGQMFGVRWFDSHGKTPTSLWVRALEDLSDKQISNGLEALSKRPDPHPPTLGQFVNLCQNRHGPDLGAGKFQKPPVDSVEIAWLNLTLLAFITREKGVPPECLPELVREKNRLASTVTGTTQAEYDEIRPGIVERFRAIVAAH